MPTKRTHPSVDASTTVHTLLYTMLRFSTSRRRFVLFFFFFQAEDGIRDVAVTGVQTCALPISMQNIVGVARAGRLDQHRSERSLGSPTLFVSQRRAKGLTSDVETAPFITEQDRKSVV